MTIDLPPVLWLRRHWRAAPKTTLLMTLAGFAAVPVHGRVLLDGTKLSQFIDEFTQRCQLFR